MGNFNRPNVHVAPATKDKPGQDLPALPQLERVPEGPYNALISAKAVKRGVPVGLAIRQAAQESANFDPKVVAGIRKSPAGASGLFQFMKPTAENVGKKIGLKPSDITSKPDAAAEAGMWYMQYLYKLFGNWKHAAWAYNWGEGNVKKFLRGEKKVLPEETRLYGLIVVNGFTPAQAKALPKNAA